MSLFALKLHGQCYEIALMFFGVYCLLVGYLLWTSSLMPKVIGALMCLAGVAYWIDTLATFLAPTYSNPFVDNVAMLALLGEGALTLWLLMFGVKEP